MIYSDKSAKPVTFRQAMDNFNDLQYYGNITVGMQELHAVLDTGSIEFVVISDKCRGWCGTKNLYHAEGSDTYKNGSTSLVLSYGSGQLTATEAYDSVSVGPIHVKTAPFWEVIDANMPLLVESDFQAIVGLGPIPTDATTLAPRRRTNDNSSAVLLKKFRIDRFGVCLGREPGSAGWFTWNDDSIKNPTFHFNKLEISDTGYWMAKLEDVRLGTQSVACEFGCGAVVDSGTSLLAMPETAYNDMARLVERLNADCQDLAQLPDLRFKLNGVQHSLPADSYMGHVYGETANSVSRHFKRSKGTHKRGKVNATACEVALMHIEMDSSLGEVWILGSPFFRKYYSVFVQGSREKKPALYTALATPECKPAKLRDSLDSLLLSPVQTRPRNIDASSLRMPPWLHRASSLGRIEENLRLKGREVVTEGHRSALLG